MPVPASLPQFVRIQEDFISASFGVVVDSQGGRRRAIWTARRMDGEATLYYRLQVAERLENVATASPAPAYPAVPQYEEPYASAVFSLLDEVRRQSADIDSFARQLLSRYLRPESDDRVQLLRQGARSQLEHVENLIHILAGARIPARVVWTLPLSEGMRNGQLQPWLQIHNEQRWITLDPSTGSSGLPDERLIWTTGPDPHITAEGAIVDQWTFAAARTHRGLLEVAQQRAADLGSSLLDFGLMGLQIGRASCRESGWWWGCGVC